MNLILRIIESIRWEFPSALEEESLKWRDKRLQDLGFLPIDENISILSYVSFLINAGNF